MDTVQAPAQTMSLGNGATFDSGGNAVNEQAMTDVNNLAHAGGVTGPVKAYTGYIPTPATTSSGNAATVTKDNLNNYNNIQTSIGNKTADQQAKDAADKAAATTGDTSSTPTTPSTGNAGVVATTNADGTISYSAKDPNDSASAAYADLQNLNVQHAQDAKMIQDKLASISNGTYVLNPAEQAQIDSIQKSIDRQVTQQTLINNTEFANLDMAGVRSGRERYTTESNDASLADAQSRELQKIVDIQNQGASLILQAKQAITQNDWKMLNDSLTDYNKSYDDQSQSILNLLKITTDQEKAQQDKLAAARQDQQLALDQQKAQQSFNKDLNITSRFFQYPGSSQVYDSKTGKDIAEAEYKALGGKGGDYSDIQQVDPSINDKHSAAYQEWKDYASTGGKLSFNDYQNMDANRKATRVTNVNTDPTKEFDLRVKQAPAQVANLAKQGYGWDQIAQYFNGLGIDPGTSVIDDALHRQFQSQADYKSWVATQYNTKHGV